MEKIKGFITSDKGKDILIVIIVILVGLSSFGLGRLSVASKSTGVKIEYKSGEENPQTSQSKETVNLEQANAISAVSSTNTSGSYFTSNRGKKYYGIGCDAGKSIKKENRVYFNSKAEAEQAGYELSSSCR